MNFYQQIFDGVNNGWWQQKEKNALTQTYLFHSTLSKVESISRKR